MKCHYIWDKKVGKIHIPYCWGAVMHGPAFCTCRDNLPDTFEAFEKKLYRDKLVEMQNEIKDLEKYNAQLQRVIKKLLKNGRNKK